MDLKGLRLDAIPRRLCHSYSAAVTLQKLDFSHNRLDVIPSDICLLTSLTELNLAKNHAITTLPADLFKLTQVHFTFTHIQPPHLRVVAASVERVLQ